MANSLAGAAPALCLLAFCLFPGPLAASEVLLTGRVTDGPGEALAGVQVRAFVAGRLAASALSDSGGRYEVAFPVEPAEDPTVVVWWLPATTDKVPELLILRESRAALESKLYGRCLPRRPLSDELAYDPVLRGEEEKLEELADSGCLPETARRLPETH